MELERHVCDRARHSRDARFDGRFFIAVTSTRVYCRPICPARTVKDANVIYLPSAAAAESAGYRPCLRCRPEASPGTPAWIGTSALVSRALRLIGDGALDHESVEWLAERLGVSGRHLRRLFLQHLGATPLEIALTRRVHFAKKLLDETSLAFEQVAFAAGFGSVRRFNSQIRTTYARTPTQLRRLARAPEATQPEHYRLRLAYRPPYDWDAMLDFLRPRAIAGVECVTDRYRRTIRVGEEHGTIDVSHAPDRNALVLEVRFPAPRALLGIVERVRRMFDLGADPAAISGHLGGDPLLDGALASHPGLRTPGVWCSFELAVCALVERHTRDNRVLDRIVSAVGSIASGHAGVDRLFPTPEQLAHAPLREHGVLLASSLHALARAVCDGVLMFDGSPDDNARLGKLPGVDPWITEYIAMRALGEPDAFPNDQDLPASTHERWRPWRSYAAMLLWESAR